MLGFFLAAPAHVTNSLFVLVSKCYETRKESFEETL